MIKKNVVLSIATSALFGSCSGCMTGPPSSLSPRISNKKHLLKSGFYSL